jgi:hypothetical protein
MSPPDWLCELHTALGLLLRSPLEVGTGRFHAADAPASLLAQVREDPGPSPKDRLVLYQEQVWQRLFHAAQQAWPRTARALTPWAFNRVALLHLTTHPPRGHDLGEASLHLGTTLRAGLGPAAAGVDERPVGDLPGPLAEALRGVLAGRTLVEQATWFDEAEAAALQARWQPWRPATTQVQPHLRLRLTPGTRLVREDHDLATWPQRPDDGLPARLPAGRTWVISRTELGTALRLIDPVHARLLTLLDRLPLAQAVQRAQATLAERERAWLEQHLTTWLRAAIEDGWLRPAAR